ncbi:hypothetical protein Pmani_022646 [Petrolisthes manimaculis]|uniref:Activator of basal transcription 1 n=1 Tax=Petrolisthes manimaculis TaxID=1843537 RepID=A0AAE1U0I1_9EUCA|nr:hypothetical protein Pmani_022646 [Petrolisthes manimaculis]
MTEEGTSEDKRGEIVEKKVKRRKPGIVYLSSIPPNMNVSKIREYFGKFGELGSIFLQATNADDVVTDKTKKRKAQHYSEGWIEFKSKRKAKQMHLFMNNQPVGGKKKNPYYDMLWNIKYLPRFKWAFLKQRLEYEREVHRQRMGAEISQVMKETDHFIKVSEITAKNKRKNKKLMKKGGEESKVKKRGMEVEEEREEKRVFVFRQKDTEEEKLQKHEQRKKNDTYKKKLMQKKKRKQANINDKKKPNDSFLDSVFVGIQ